MDEQPISEREPVSVEEPASSSKPSAWPWVAVVLLSCAFVIASVMYFREQDARRHLADANTQMTSDLSQMHDQIQDLGAKITALTVAPPAQPATPTVASTSSSQLSGTAFGRHRGAKRPAKDDPRWKQLQSELAENKAQLDATQQDVAKNRADLEGNLSSTRDELNGSIAKTHDELVAMEKRGERSYFEFNLTKSKAFEHVGPLSLSLHKTNIKNAFYDMAVLVEDSRVTKKHVNLYEPVLFYSADSRQPTAG